MGEPQSRRTKGCVYLCGPSDWGSLLYARSLPAAHPDAYRLEITIWLVPSLIGNALAVSIVGLLLGPMYPICMNEVGRVLPRRVLTGSIGMLTYFRRRPCSSTDQGLRLDSGLWPGGQRNLTLYDRCSRESLWHWFAAAIVCLALLINLTLIDLPHRIVTMMAFMAFLWALVPSTNKRAE